MTGLNLAHPARGDLYATKLGMEYYSSRPKRTTMYMLRARQYAGGGQGTR